MDPKVYLLVLNWNMYEDTLECLKSLRRLTYSNYKILLVDNASRDNSVNNIRKLFSDIEIIENKENMGFAKGNNIGMRYAFKQGADYVCVLNNDIIVEEDFIQRLIDVAEKEESQAIFSPIVYYYDKRNIVNSLGTTINWLRLRPNLAYCGTEDKGQFTDLHEAEILVGCSLLFKRKLIEKIGLFDEDFFIFCEDADICLRNIRRGGKNIVVTKSKIYHKASATMKNYSAVTMHYSIRNFLYLAQRHASVINKIKVFFGLAFLSLKHSAVLLRTFGSNRLSKAFFLGLRDYLSGRKGKILT